MLSYILTVQSFCIALCSLHKKILYRIVRLKILIHHPHQMDAINLVPRSVYKFELRKIRLVDISSLTSPAFSGLLTDELNLLSLP